MTTDEQIFNHSNQMLDDAVTKAINAQAEPIRTFTNDQLIDQMMINAHKIHKNEDMNETLKAVYTSGYLHSQLVILMNKFPEVLAEIVDYVNWQNQNIEREGL